MVKGKMKLEQDYNERTATGRLQPVIDSVVTELKTV